MKASKKSLCFVLAAIMLLQCAALTATAVEADKMAVGEPTYILYEENFDDVNERVAINEVHNVNGAAAGWILSNKSGTAESYIEDGKLYLTGSKYDLIYRDGGATWGNYTVEADICYMTGTKSSGYVGLLFNVQSETKFQKGSITPSGEYALNGYDGAWVNNDDSLNKGDYSGDKPTVGAPFRLKIVVENKTATLYYKLLNGDVAQDFVKLLEISNIPAESQTGSIGFVMPKYAGTKCWMDNIICYSNTLVSYSEDFEAYGDLALTANAENTDIGVNYIKNSTVTGAAGIKDGELYLSGGTNKLDAIFFTMGENWTNYEVEADITVKGKDDIVSGSNNNGWCGLMFRSADTKNFIRAKVGTSSNGVADLNVRGKSGSTSWYTEHSSTQGNYNGTIATNVAFRMKIQVIETEATLYVAPYSNGALGEWVSVVTVKDTYFPVGCMTGTIGIQVGGGGTKTYNMSVDNITVSRIVGADRYYEDTSNAADIYEPESGIVNPPVVVQTLTDTLPSVEGERAAVVMAEINETLDILGSNGNILTTASEFIDTYRKVLIPAFLVDSEAEAKAIAALIEEKNLIDCYVIAEAENAALVKNVRLANDVTSYISGALIFDNLNELESRQSARALVADNMCYAAISRAPLGEDAARYFNLRQIAAWGCAANAEDIYCGIANGWHGIVSEDVSTVYGVYESITETTVSGKPIIIAHRGVNSGSEVQYPENTLIGIRAAKEIYGADAAEIDFGLTSDGYVILMHDNTVDRTTNGTGNFSSMTLEQIKTLTVDYVEGKETTVPTLEEVLQLAKELGLVLYCHTKSNSDANIAAFSYLVEKYECQDLVVLFGADRATYNSVNESVADSSAYGFTEQAVVTDGIIITASNQEVLTSCETYTEGIVAMRKCLAPYNCQALFYSYGKQGEMWNKETFYYQLSARGIVNLHSVTDGQTDMDSSALTGTGAVGFLTNNLHLCDDYHYAIDLSDENTSFTVGETVCVEKTLKMILGDVTAACGFLQLDGPAVIVVDGGFTLTENGSVTVVYYADRTADGGSKYRVYSQPVELNFDYLANVAVEGFQTRDGEQENTADARFVATLRGDYRDYSSVGFEFTYNGKVASRSCKYVYTALNAAGELITPEKFNADYFFCYSIEGLSEGDYSFDVRCWAIQKGSNETRYCESVTLSLSVAADGSVTVKN